MERDILKQASAYFAQESLRATRRSKSCAAGAGSSGGASADTRHAEGLMHNSDRGSQYCSHEYQALLRGHGMRASETSS
jgi:transposase InsO family protein